MSPDEKNYAGDTGVCLVLVLQMLQLDRQTDRRLSVLVKDQEVLMIMSPRVCQLGASWLKRHVHNFAEQISNPISGVGKLILTN